MENLLNQIAECYQDKSENYESRNMALRDIFLSAAYRCGFSKEWAWLKELDQTENGILYMCFMKTKSDSAIPVDDHLKYINDELLAFGVDITVKNNGNGLEIVSDDRNYGVIIYLCEKSRPYNLEILYRTAPLPYELRTAAVTGGKNSSSLQREFGLFIAGNEKQKKGPGRPKKQKKQNEEQAEQWLQPSLFDF